MFAFNRMFFAFLFIAFSGSCNASITIEGSDVSFTYDNSLANLFGTPKVSGNSLIFAPTNFSSTSIGTSGWGDIVASQFAVTIQSLAGKTIESIGLTEKGDYKFKGPTPELDLSGSLTVTDLSNSVSTIKVNFIPTAPLFPETGLHNSWDAQANVTLNNLPNPSYSALVNISNTLTTGAFDLKDLAFINKTFVGLTASTVTAVPLPQAVWLFGAGLMGLLSMSKRKKLI